MSFPCQRQRRMRPSAGQAARECARLRMIPLRAGAPQSLLPPPQHPPVEERKTPEPRVSTQVAAREVLPQASGAAPCPALEAGGLGTFQGIDSWFWKPLPSHRSRARWPPPEGSPPGRGGGLRKAAEQAQGGHHPQGSPPSSTHLPSPSLHGLICTQGTLAALPRPEDRSEVGHWEVFLNVSLR